MLIWNGRWENGILFKIARNLFSETYFLIIRSPSVFRKFVDYFIMKILYVFIDITFFEFLRGGSCPYLLPLGDALAEK